MGRKDVEGRKGRKGIMEKSSHQVPVITFNIIHLIG
jgi:hypothetical protein